MLITGRPGVGKTTVFMKVLNIVREKGLRVAGFMCPEVRERGTRIGFRIVDIRSGEQGWLALRADMLTRFGKRGTLRIGRYIVVEDDALRVGLRALDELDRIDLLAIDELGPMELSLPKLRSAIVNAIKRIPRGILVVHRKFNDLQIWEELRGHGYKLFVVDVANRDRLPIEVAKYILQC